jgi:hypothetical protein
MAVFQRSMSVPNAALPFTLDLGPAFLALDVCPSLAAAVQGPCSVAGPCPACSTGFFLYVAVSDSPGPLSHSFRATLRFIFSSTNVM